jgi:ABC-type cobalamin transport system permease subunit
LWVWVEVLRSVVGLCWSRRCLELLGISGSLLYLCSSGQSMSNDDDVVSMSGGQLVWIRGPRILDVVVGGLICSPTHLSPDGK